MSVANVFLQQVLLRRGNTSSTSTYTGPIGEVIIDTDLHTLRVQDGITPGGVSILATQSQIDTLSNSISAITGIDGNIITEITNILSGNVSFGNIIPSANVVYDLGSPTRQWGNLYVSSDTIYIAGVPLRVDAGGNLTINGNSVGCGSGPVGTRWDVPADGCPIYAELSPEHFSAYTQNSHLELDNGGSWNIGSNFNGAGVFGSGNDATVYSNRGNVVVRTNDSQSYFTFDNTGSLTVPTAVKLPYGSLGAVFGPGITMIANVDAGQEFAAMTTGNTSNAGQSLIYTEQNNIGFEIIDTNTGVNSGWTFDSTGRTVLPGNLVFADSTVQTTAFTGQNLTTGNIGFIADAMYDINGITVENADLSHGATAAVIIPANGSTTPVQVNNTYGGIAIQAGTGADLTAAWTFGADGNVALPNGYRIGGGDAGRGIELTTDRGTVLFGNHPEPGAPSHFHIMKDNVTGVDLYFGDDFNYVKLPGLDGPNYGVEVGSSDIGNNGPEYKWRFETDGKLTFPDGSAQTTAYVHNNVNLDGGGASTVYEVETAYADGGFASIRSFSETFDGNEGNNYILDGGRA
jgi:hypothetical protein